MAGHHQEACGNHGRSRTTGAGGKGRRAPTRRQSSRPTSPGRGGGHRAIDARTGRAAERPPPSTSALSHRWSGAEPTVRGIMHTDAAAIDASKDRPCLTTGPAERRPSVSRARPLRRRLCPNPSNRQCSQRPLIRSVRRNSLSSRQTAYLKIVVSAVRFCP